MSQPTERKFKKRAKATLPPTSRLYDTRAPQPEPQKIPKSAPTRERDKQLELEFFSRLLNLRVENRKVSGTEKLLPAAQSSTRDEDFRSSQDYVRFFERLLFLNLLGRLKSNLEDCKLAFPVSAVEDPYSFRSGSVRVKLHVSADKASFCPKDLVLLSVTRILAQKLEVLARVEDVGRAGDKTILAVVIEAGAVDALELREKLPKVMESPKPLDRDVSVHNVLSALTGLREFMALHNCHHSPLLPYILDPLKTPVENPVKLWESVPPLLQTGFSTLLNEGQMAAVKHALNACSILPTDTCGGGITLIQGPPGTGKTKTVLALLNAIHITRYLHYYQTLVSTTAQMLQAPTGQNELVRAFKEGKLRRPRILVCAPSNCAVDEIIDRLFSEGLVDGSGSRYNPDIVRVGSASKMRGNVKDMIWIDSLTEAFAKYSLEQLNARIGEYAQKVEQCKHVLMHTLQSPLPLGSAGEVAATYAEQHETSYRIGLELQRLVLTRDAMLRTGSKLALRQSFLNEAHIVFSTLSNCGSNLFKEIKKFDVCIIDEAAQCVEAEILIPLRLGCTNCVLVGDPQQLPATTFITGSDAALYERSMFQRLQERGHAAILLSLQYRMHPEICRFPSKFFYEDRLQNGERVMSPEYTLSLHEMYGPYVFFDLAESSSEQRSGHSLLNKKEALYVRMLIGNISTNFGLQRFRIGVVTPYREQRRELQTTLRDFPEVEVETIDSFQGREKDIIIMSCVRAQNNSTGIGFVADIRRMNVAITRAKYALWIVGHASTLKSSKAWDALLLDAEERGCLRRVAPENPQVRKRFSRRDYQKIVSKRGRPK